MPKQMFEQPIDAKNEGEMSQEERDVIIKEKEVWLQGLMNLALEKLDSDFEAGFIPEDFKKKYYDSLLERKEEIASADEKSKNVHETLARLEEIGSRFESLLGIKEVVGVMRKKYEDAWIRACIKAEKEKGVEIELPHEKIGGDKSEKRKDRTYRGVGFLGMRNKVNIKNHRRAPMPPAV